MDKKLSIGCPSPSLPERGFLLGSWQMLMVWSDCSRCLGTERCSPSYNSLLHKFSVMLVPDIEAKNEVQTLDL